MALAKSKVTPQGRISVPAAVRETLGIVPGSTLEWEEEEEDKVVVRRSGRYTSADIRSARLGDSPPPHKSDEELREGVMEYFGKRHAKR